MNNLRKLIHKSLKEEIKSINDFLLIVRKGTELFHGTIEEYPKDQVRPGGYDSVFWTTTESIISQTYIPTSGGKYHLSSEHLAAPASEESIRSMQRQIGINYDYSQAEFEGHQVKSYREAPEFAEASNHYQRVFQDFFKADQELENFKKHFNKLPYDQRTDELLKKFSELENNKEDLKKKYYSTNLKKLKNEFVNKKLEEFGYKPDNFNSYNSNSQWSLKVDLGKIQPADYKAKGRLLIITPNRDLKIYDTTMGGKREGDLTDVDYHKHNWFEMAKNQGYDGIRITDFAQSEDMGNFGHTAIGLFKNTLKDVSIEEIEASHQPLDGNYLGSDYESPEYKKFKNKLNEHYIKDHTIDKILKMFALTKENKIGEGSYGIAFHYGSNLVLKISTDQSEAVLANKIKHKKFTHIAEVYDVKKLKNENVFIIILEKLEPLPDEMFDQIRNLVDIEEYYIAHREENQNFKEWIEKNKNHEFFSYDQKKYLNSEPIENVINLRNQLRAVMKELDHTPHLRNMGYMDAHPGNMGFKKGNLGIYDVQALDFKSWRLKQIKSVAN